MTSDTDIVLLDNNTPIEKFEHYIDRYPAMAVLLLWMHAIDSTLSTLNFKAPIYILDDETLYKQIIEDDPTINSDQLKLAMIYLTQSQMIYRFTVALKFLINDKSIKQLRINSWGRKYCSDKLLPRNYILYERYLNRVTEKFNLNRPSYVDALKLFQGIDKKKINADDLKELNYHLAIKVVC
jgi:hypothetical protein